MIFTQKVRITQKVRVGAAGGKVLACLGVCVGMCATCVPVGLT